MDRAVRQRGYFKRCCSRTWLQNHSGSNCWIPDRDDAGLDTPL